VRYAWIKQYRDSFSVIVMCRVLSVSTSGFYKWRKAVPSPRARRGERIRATVREIHEQSHQIYGSYKIAEIMQTNDEMETACRNTVATAMREIGLKSRVVKKFTPTTTVVDPTKRPASNVLNQDFSADAPNRKWVTDITYLPTQSGWVYLAVVLDLFSRKVVGWSIADSLATTLVSSALKNAIESRRPATRQLLHHSDRGCQYTSDSYRTTLRTLGITCSMSRTGCCYDNAVMERFFWSLKHEWTKHEEFADLEDARLSVFRYIETFYNSERLHQTLHYQSPTQFESNHARQLAG
jgi:putative transposase